jgi:dienelactone hydrolase
MPNKTAEYQGPFLKTQFNISADLTPLFLEARLPVCPDNPSRCSPLDDSPILLFSPGYGIPRLYYNVLASAIASEGFIVITIDHPEDANIIAYPDGHVVYNNGPSSPNADEYTRYVYPRVADASFIIDQLSNATAIAALLPQRGPRQFPTDRVAMLGHSLGGAAAVIAADQDPRLRGAINWDGTLFGELPPSGLFQPVLYMSEANATDPSWVAAWPQLKGPKLWVTVASTTHESFTDALTLLQAAGQDTAALAGLLGTIAPDKTVRILAAYTTAWMNGAFTGKVGGPLLQGQEPGRFLEVSTVTKSNF